MNWEDKLRRLAQRYSGGPGKERALAERKLNKWTRSIKKGLCTACKQTNGHRENMVVVIGIMGTVYTNVTPMKDGRFTGRRYPAKYEGNVPCGQYGIFTISMVREFHVVSKNATITRR